MLVTKEYKEVPFNKGTIQNQNQYGRLYVTDNIEEKAVVILPLQLYEFNTKLYIKSDREIEVVIVPFTSQ